MREFMIKYWIEFTFGAAITALGMAYKRLRKRLCRQVALEVGIQSLLRDRIIQMYNHYKEKAFCPIYAKENVEKLYSSYHGLGGNGTVKELVEEMMGMPTDPPERK